MNVSILVGMFIIFLLCSSGCIDTPPAERIHVTIPEDIPTPTPKATPEPTPEPTPTPEPNQVRVYKLTPKYTYPTHEELETVLNTHHHERGYEADVYDCSNMSIRIAWFLQETYNWDTVLVGNRTNFKTPHAWVLVRTGKNEYTAIETTYDPLNCLGKIIYIDTNPEYYKGLDIVYEWDEAHLYIS